LHTRKCEEKTKPVTQKSWIKKTEHGHKREKPLGALDQEKISRHLVAIFYLKLRMMLGYTTAPTCAGQKTEERGERHEK
jgi:hypothetical protein